ncbi:aspartic peptidase domain-containing protein [Phascolomyces articulosus]|uniref:Aspartic peptidase domain-containing protein n=1 Tax=Phascolomyces articulosus TaxID=60185 RepID=A0AAD5PK02_9FUNG|nr:aspartic peptidase domain-containing protein [Phascolomyces articulosus]
MPSSSSPSSALTAHFDVFGYPECDYHVKLQVGSTKMNLILDTGSSNTAVISDHCNSINCTFVQKPYLSVHSEALLNRVSARYGNAKTRASWHGYATGQIVELQQDKSVLARVDVITKSNHFFVPGCPQNQGLWGLAYPELQTRPHHSRYLNRALSSETLIDSARHQLHMPNSFSFQLCPKSSVDPLSSYGLSVISTSDGDLGFDSVSASISEQEDQEKSLTALLLEQEHGHQQLSTAEASSLSTSICSNGNVGHFWLGGYASRFVRSPIIWVPLIHSHYYEVSIDGFFINDQMIEMDDNLNTPRTIVDTGTNDIVLSTENLQRFLRALWKSNVILFDRAFISPEYERAFWLDHAQLTLPTRAVKIDTRTTVSVSLGGQLIYIPLENLVKVHPILENEGQTSSPAWINISWTGLSHGGGTHMAGTILGNTLMRGKTTIWDRGAGRLGFADADPNICCQSSSAKDVDTLLSLNREDGTFSSHLSRYKSIDGGLLPSNSRTIMLGDSSSMSHTASVSPGSQFICVLSMGLIAMACIGGLVHTTWMAWLHFYVKPRKDRLQMDLKTGEQTPAITIDLPPMPFKNVASIKTNHHEQQQQQDEDYEII